MAIRKIAVFPDSVLDLQVQELVAAVRRLEVAMGGRWTAGATKKAGGHVLPVADNGFYYACVTAGMTGASQPAWPLTLGQRVTDGAVVWECAGMIEPF